MTLNKKLVVIFVSIFVIFASAACIINTIQPKNSTALITVDGKEAKKIDLTKDQEFDINTQYGTNSILVKDGKIYMKDASCPDKLCVRHGKLQNKYDAIVCLPNKVIVEYKNGADVDAVSGR